MIGAPIAIITPTAHLASEPYHTAVQQTHGVYRGAPILSDLSDLSDRSDTSATPPQFRTPPLPSSCLAYPTAHLRPSHTRLRHCKPSGYTGAHQLVRLVRLVRQVRHKRHAHAPRTPPLPSDTSYSSSESAPSMALVRLSMILSARSR